MKRISQLLFLLGIATIFGGIGIEAVAKDNHKCTPLGTKTCKGTGDQRCKLYAGVTGNSCDGTNCHYCDNTQAINDNICLYLEGSTCTITEDTIDCSSSTTYWADACTKDGTKCECKNAQPHTSGTKHKCESKTYNKCTTS